MDLSIVILILFILIVLIIIFGTFHYVKKAHQVTNSKEFDSRLMNSITEEINNKVPSRTDTEV